MLNELKKLKEIIASLDRKIIIIFISVAVLQTVSWYYTSRKFFRYYIFDFFNADENIYLIEYLYLYIGDFFIFFVTPFLIIKLIFKEKITGYGLTLGDKKFGIKATLISVSFMFVIVWFVSASNEFASIYPHLQSAKESWRIFIIYQIGMLLYMLSWEFVWRGYMLFGLKEKFGYYAVLIQMIPFVILHNGKPPLETFSSILGGIVLGILALRTFSIWYCVIIHFLLMLSIDTISTLRFRADDYGIGFSSFINLLNNF